MVYRQPKQKTGQRKRGSNGRCKIFLTGVTTLFLTLAQAGPSFPSREEILAAVYPHATITSERIFLTDREVKAVEQSSGVEVPSPLIARYGLSRGNRIVGRAYVDTHIVRTKRESLLICLDTDGTVKRVEVTAFLEPPEYQLSQAWYRQYENKSEEELMPTGAIRSVAGATLTSRAAGRAVRRVIQIDRILQTRSHQAEEKP